MTEKALMNEDYIRILEDFLQGKASVEEIRLLQSQLDDTSRWDDWSREKWDASGDELDEYMDKKMFSAIRGAIRRKRNDHFRKAWNMAASLLILVLSFSALYFFFDRKKTQALRNDMVIKVERGQKASVTLPDNTVVWLNSDSELRYNADFNSHERRIELSGEAYFDVASRPGCPFIVSSGDLEIKALGTHFDVKAYPEDLSVSVLLVEGKVDVSSPSETIRLLPDQLATYDKDNAYLDKVTLDDTDAIMAWMENKFIFESNSLLEITDILSRRYNVRFEFSEELLKNYQYSGIIDNTSLQSILEMVSLTSPVNYHLNDSVIVLSENVKNKKKYDTNINP